MTRKEIPTSRLLAPRLFQALTRFAHYIRTHWNHSNRTQATVSRLLKVFQRLKETGIPTLAICLNMAKSSLLSVLLVAFLGASLSFVGLRAAPRQESRTALRGQAGASATPWTPVLTRDVVEIEFTAPAQGARCRFMIKADADATEVLSEGRKRLGFDQAWMPDSDFQIYNSEDEEAGPLKGKMRDNGLIDFTYEVHLYYEPK